jgi:hypothetical protein
MENNWPYQACIGCADVREGELRGRSAAGNSKLGIILDRTSQWAIAPPTQPSRAYYEALDTAHYEGDMAPFAELVALLHKSCGTKADVYAQQLVPQGC